MIDLRNELIISEIYKIKITEEEISSVILSHSDKEKFKSLNASSKLTRLEYLKKKKSIEKTLVKIVTQSRYLKLYKDNNGFHLRYDEDIEDNLEEEIKIVEYIKLYYSFYVNEDFNTGMSGDINRILISKGTLT
jgi:hypothetical protein